MTPAEKQRLDNLEAAVKYLSFLTHGEARSAVEEILSRQPEPAAEPDKCNLGTPGCLRLNPADNPHTCEAYCCTAFEPRETGNCRNCGLPKEDHRQPAAPESPAPCPDGHVPKIVERLTVRRYRQECFSSEHADVPHWLGPESDTPEAATREWNKVMRHG